MFRVSWKSRCLPLFGVLISIECRLRGRDVISAPCETHTGSDWELRLVREREWRDRTRPTSKWVGQTTDTSVTSLRCARTHHYHHLVLCRNQTILTPPPLRPLHRYESLSICWRHAVLTSRLASIARCVLDVLRAAGVCVVALEFGVTPPIPSLPSPLQRALAARSYINARVTRWGANESKDLLKLSTCEQWRHSTTSDWL